MHFEWKNKNGQTVMNTVMLQDHNSDAELKINMKHGESAQWLIMTGKP